MPSHSKVCHAWAHQTGRNRTGFNVYYDGATIYSYGSHFPIARLVTVKGQTVVLFTTKSRSCSTTRHKSYVCQATTHLEHILTADPRSESRVGDFDDALFRAKGNIATAARARVHGDMHMSEAADNIAMANRINELWDLGRGRVTLESLGANVADIEARIEAGRIAEAARQAKAEKEAFARQEEMRAAWLGGERIHFHGTDGEGGALVRVVGDELQTSKGASVPLAHAVRAFRFIKLVRERGEPWAANGHSLRVGEFRASVIDADGTLHVGCHTIRWPEIERLALQLGVYTQPASDEALTPAHDAA